MSHGWMLAIAFALSLLVGASVMFLVIWLARVQMRGLLYDFELRITQIVEARCEVCPRSKTLDERIKRVELSITSAGESHVRIQDSLALIRRDLNAQAELIAKERRQNGLAIDTLTTACQASVAACTSLSTQTERLLARIKET
jgi:hypothetical protein